MPTLDIDPTISILHTDLWINGTIYAKMVLLFLELPIFQRVGGGIWGVYIYPKNLTPLLRQSYPTPLSYIFSGLDNWFEGITTNFWEWSIKMNKTNFSLSTYQVLIISQIFDAVEEKKMKNWRKKNNRQVLSKHLSILD